MGKERKGYIARPLFKAADQRESVRIGELVRKEIPEIAFYNPAENDEINDKEASVPTPLDIFDIDTVEVLGSDTFVGEIDGDDPGVYVEFGIALTTNLMLDILEEELGKEARERIEERVPAKDIYMYSSDIRQASERNRQLMEIEALKGIEQEGKTPREVQEELNEVVGSYTQAPSYGVNYYVLGGINAASGRLYGSIEEVVEEIKEGIRLEEEVTEEDINKEIRGLEEIKASVEEVIKSVLEEEGKDSIRTASLRLVTLVKHALDTSIKRLEEIKGRERITVGDIEVAKDLSKKVISAVTKEGEGVTKEVIKARLEEEIEEMGE